MCTACDREYIDFIVVSCTRLDGIIQHFILRRSLRTISKYIIFFYFGVFFLSFTLALSLYLSRQYSFSFYAFVVSQRHKIWKTQVIPRAKQQIKYMHGWCTQRTAYNRQSFRFTAIKLKFWHNLHKTTASLQYLLWNFTKNFSPIAISDPWAWSAVEKFSSCSLIQ